MPIIQLGDNPTIQFSVTEDDAALDLSGASAVSLLFRKPSGATVTKVGTLADSSTISADLDAEDVDEAGGWRVQAVIEGLAGWSGSSRYQSFAVRDNL